MTQISFKDIMILIMINEIITKYSQVYDLIVLFHKDFDVISEYIKLKKLDNRYSYNYTDVEKIINPYVNDYGNLEIIKMNTQDICRFLIKQKSFFTYFDEDLKISQEVLDFVGIFKTKFYDKDSWYKHSFDPTDYNFSKSMNSFFRENALEIYIYLYKNEPEIFGCLSLFLITYATHQCLENKIYDLQLQL